MLELSEQQRRELRRLSRRAPRGHVRLKALGLWNLGRGKRPGEVADILGVHPRTLRAWVHRYQAEGAAGLAVRPGRGRPAQADAAELETALRQAPRAYGLTQTRWTLRALAQVVPSLQGFTDAGVRQVLQRLGYRYKRGQPRLTSPDPAYAEKRGAWSRSSGRPRRSLARS